MTISLMSYVHTPFVSSMKHNRVKAFSAMKVEIQSRKLIKPSISTPPNLRCYKISFIDEFPPTMNLPLVLFYPPNTAYNPQFVAQLEESLEKILTLLYPLAGRYIENIRAVHCNDQGVEFIQAQVDSTLEETLDHKNDHKLINEFIPSNIWDKNQATDPLLATQITKFKCGGLALGVSMAHRIGDASSMITFLNQWATLSRKEANVELGGLDFTLSSLFPAQGLPPAEVGFFKMSDNDDYVTKKLSFNESAISNMKAKVMRTVKGKSHQLFKVNLVSTLIWKAFIGVDHAIHGHARASVLVQPLALRQRKEKIASIKPKYSLGNQWGAIATECDNTKTINGFEDLTDMSVDSITKTIKDYSKVGYDSGERKHMVLKSFNKVNNILDTTNVIWIVSWCKFPFYDVNFGFGKPIWISCRFAPFKRGAMLLDDAKGNGVEACVTMGVKDVPYFEQDEDIKAFST